MGEKLGSQSTAGDGGQFSRRTEVAIRGTHEEGRTRRGLFRGKGQHLTFHAGQTGRLTLRDDAKARQRLEVFVLLKDQVEVLFGRTDANVVERDVPFSVDVLAARLRFLLGLGDEFGIFRVGVVGRVVVVSGLVGKVRDDGLERFGGRVGVDRLVVKASDDVPLALEVFGLDFFVDRELRKAARARGQFCSSIRPSARTHRVAVGALPPDRGAPSRRDLVQAHRGLARFGTEVAHNGSDKVGRKGLDVFFRPHGRRHGRPRVRHEAAGACRFGQLS